MIRAIAVGCLVGLVIAISSVNSACFVDRASDKLQCTGQSICAGGRVCEDGYCVIDHSQCPRQCTTCDVTADPPICNIDLSGSSGDSITCPSNMHCEVTCRDTNSCGSVTCSDNDPCNVSCLAKNACRDVSCGTGACNVMCTGMSACGNVSCTDSCACDVTCPQADCGTLDCPGGGSGFCTTTGRNNQPCSSAISGCRHC